MILCLINLNDRSALFTYPYAILNLYELLPSVKHETRCQVFSFVRTKKNGIFRRIVPFFSPCNETQWGPRLFWTLLTFTSRTKTVILRSAEEKESYRFEMTCTRIARSLRQLNGKQKWNLARAAQSSNFVHNIWREIGVSFAAAFLRGKN